jgi:2'-5' RNA ligase
MIRAFLALEFPASISEKIAGYIKSLQNVSPKTRWVDPRKAHLTLKFFGSLEQEALDRIATALAPLFSSFAPFRLTLNGAGGFPKLFRPRVIWVGLGAEKEHLKGLQQAVEETLFPLGIAREERPFHPHLTLGRNKIGEANEPLYHLLRNWAEPESEPFRVDEVILFQSDLKPGGPVYTKLKVFPLGEK